MPGASGSGCCRNLTEGVRPEAYSLYLRGMNVGPDGGDSPEPPRPHPADRLTERPAATDADTRRAAILSRIAALLFFFSYDLKALSQCCNVPAERSFQVGCLVLVDDIGLSQFVQHLLYGRIELYSLFLVRQIAQLANSITHGLSIVSVVQRLDFVLTDSLQ